MDQKEDYHLANVYFFTYFTIGCLLFSYMLYYYPYIEYDDDFESLKILTSVYSTYSGYDWAQREAFLEVHRREKLGLPFIDPNLVDPEKITLPSEEELKELNFEIHL